MAQPTGSESPPSLAEQIVEASREGVKRLKVLGRQLDTSRKEEQSPKDELEMVMAQFATDNLVSFNIIADISRSPELEAATKVWAEAALRRKLVEAAFSALLASKVEEIRGLAGDRIIRASSLNGRGFGVGDGYGTLSGPGSPTDVEGPLIAVEPYTGSLAIGTPQRHYDVVLFDLGNPDRNVATIEVR